MTASDWKIMGRASARAEAVELELPSGMKLMARRPSPLQVAMWGQLPLRLAAVVMGEESAAPRTEDVIAGVKLSRDLLAYCCVSPRISMEPKDDWEIHPRDIEMTDVLFILRWAHRGEEAESLRTFRDKREAAGAGEDSGEVRPAPLADARYHGRRTSAGSGSGSGGGADA